MQNRRRPLARFVVCIENTGYPASLELHKIYRVVPGAERAADGDIRVVDESGEDYLYPMSFFAPITLPIAVKKSFQRAEPNGAANRSQPSESQASRRSQATSSGR